MRPPPEILRSFEGTHLRRNGSLAEKLRSGELDPEQVASLQDEARRSLLSRGTFHVRSFQASFFAKIHPRFWGGNSWSLKRTTVEKNGKGINPERFFGLLRRTEVFKDFHLPMDLFYVHVVFIVFYFVKSLVGFKGNLSRLAIYVCFFPQGLRQMEEE